MKARERVHADTNALVSGQLLPSLSQVGLFVGPLPTPACSSATRYGAPLDPKREFGLPVLVSVSRKSFLRAITGRPAVSEAGPATLAAEFYAAATGADFIRTHDVAALCDRLRIVSALHARALTY